jgi:hypothetical protein
MYNAFYNVHGTSTAMIHDRPKHTKVDDRFGFAPCAADIAGGIAGAPAAGITVAVYGLAGSGKSSFLNFMDERLNDLGCPTVRMSAQSIHCTNGTCPALVEEIRRQLGSDHPPPDDIRQGVPKLTTSLGPAIEDLVPEDKKAVIIIDDLDRCQPNDVVGILDLLGSSACGDRCVFVIAADRTFIERAVASHYGATQDNYGRDYLDRVVHTQFDMPPISLRRLSEVYSEELDALQLRKQNVNVISAAADGNPRRMIRLLNAFGHMRVPEGYQSDDLAGELPTLWERAYVFVTCLRTCFPDAYRTCAQNPESCESGLDLLSARELFPSDHYNQSSADAFEPYRRNTALRRFLQRVVDISFPASPPWKEPEMLQEAIELVEA